MKKIEYNGKEYTEKGLSKEARKNLDKLDDLNESLKKALHIYNNTEEYSDGKRVTRIQKQIDKINDRLDDIEDAFNSQDGTPDKDVDDRLFDRDVDRETDEPTEDEIEHFLNQIC